MFEKFTEKARELVQTAQEILTRYKHTQLDTEHLLLAMLEQNDGLAVQVLQNLAVDTRTLTRATEDALARAPKVQYADQGAQIYITPRIKKVFDLAKDEAGRLQDSYIGVEHLLLGLVGRNRRRGRPSAQNAGRGRGKSLSRPAKYSRFGPRQRRKPRR